MIPLFCGMDNREKVGLSVFCSSVWSRASQPVSITPISGATDGTNAFTLARFLVPQMMGYKGFAIFADGSDMLCLADIAELWALCDPFKAVQVVKHDYKTNFPVKYLGQKNLSYPRKNWSSLMLINCNHFAWRRMDAEAVQSLGGQVLHRFEFIKDEFIGELPPVWNYLVSEPNQTGPAKIAHMTIGIAPFYPDHEYAKEWFKERESMLYHVDWSSK